MSNSEITLDPNFTAITTLIDTSGSMAQIDTTELAQSTNTLIKDKCQDDQSVVFYGGSFSDNFEIFADGVDGKEVTITTDMIRPHGMTSLVPAFARMIRHTGKKLSDMKDKRPGTVIFILLSDGEQTTDTLFNSIESDRPYEGSNGYVNLKKLVEEHQSVYNWKFFFLGTNFDSISVGSKFGINKGSCMNYQFSNEGATSALRACSDGIDRSRQGVFKGFTNEERNNSAHPE